MRAFNKISLVVVALGMTSGTIACSGEVGSADDARAGWAKTNATLSAGGAAAQGAPGAPADGDSAPRALPVAVDVDFTYACPGGGDIRYVGTYDVATGGASADVTFNYTATFDGCDAGGLTVDGELDYASSVQTTDTSSAVQFSYKGELTWKGDVDGSCAISMEASVSATVGAASVTYKGSICGYDAAATLNVGG